MAASAAATAKSSLSRNVRAKGSRRGGRVSAGRLALFLAAAAVAAYLGFWIVRLSAVEAFVRENPFAAAAIAPGNPKSKMAVAMTEFALRNGAVSPASRSSATDALAQSALSEEPFLLEAVAALAAGNSKKGEQLLAEAQRRNPRSRTARLLLLDRYLRANRGREASVEMSVLTRLIPQAGGVLMPELARLAKDPATAQPLIQMMRRDPAMRTSMLEYLASTATDPEMILRIAAVDPQKPPPEGWQWQRSLIAKLIERGELARAQTLWRQFAGVSGAAEGGVYDPGFKGLPGAAPFNWDLAGGSEGTAERTGSGLSVGYYGRSNFTLARQLLMLRPGRYRLQMRAEGDAKGDGSRLTWTVSCVPGDKAIAQIALTDIVTKPRKLTADFAVPAGCAGQWLTLAGTRGDIPSEQDVTIHDVAITAGGGQ
jgi:hypothetical protein